MFRRTTRPAIVRVAGVALVAAAVAIPADGSAASGPTVDAAVAAIQRGDYSKAHDQLKPLATKGDPNAEFLLGMLYDAGKGVAQDQVVAASWYRKAADQKHLMAQLYLAVLYYSGEGVTQDHREAARWFQAAAASGNDLAQFYLGSMYATGTGVKKDGDRAIQWLSKSAAQRNTRAMGMLASELFSRSRGDQDLVDAYVWSHLAAEYDRIQAATSARAVIAKYCNDDQEKRAKQAMAEWKRRWDKESKTRRP